MIEAVNLLRKKHPKIYYYIVGSGPDEADLKNRAHRLGVDACVNFFSYASPENIPNLLRHADFFVLPSLVEGLPSAVLEAMACGLPVVLASSNYSCQGLFKNEENVLIVSADSSAIAEAIDRLASDSQLRTALSQNGHNYV